MSHKISFKILIFIGLCSLIDCNLFDLLFKYQGDLIVNIRQCLENESQGLNYLLTDVNNLENIYNDIKHRNINVFENPIHLYLFQRRLLLLQQIENVLLSDGCTNEYLKTDDLKDIFPKDEQITDVLLSLIRLQKMHRFNTTDLANGIVNGIDSHISMSAFDCFDVAQRLHQISEDNYAGLWLVETISRYINLDPNDEKAILFQVELRNFLVDFYVKLNKPREIFTVVGKLFHVTRDSAVIKRNLNDLLRLQQESTDQQKHELDSYERSEKTVIQPNGNVNFNAFEKIQYQRLCRNEIQSSAKLLTPLRCRYISHSPFSRIAPFKMEELHRDPYIVVYHKVIHDNEIEILKNISFPLLERSGVSNLNSEISNVTLARTSAIVFLPDDYHKIIKVVSARIGDMTGLDMTTSEPLQIAHYGIGGHYVPHWDYFGSADQSELFKQLGDRIATFLLYMNDVESGGETVFPCLNLRLVPEKGSAAFWYNLHRSGEGDPRTRHAACPVVIGTKWVSNKWILPKGQTFKRLCGRQDDTILFADYVKSIRIKN